MSARFTADRLPAKYQAQVSAQLHGTPPAVVCAHCTPGTPTETRRWMRSNCPYCNGTGIYAFQTVKPPAPAIAPRRPVAVAGQTKPGRPKTAPSKSRPEKGQGKRVGRVPRTRNGGKWTEAQYWQAVRSALRRGFRFWKPIVDALKAAKTPFRGPHGQRFAYLCAGCGKLHPRKAVNVDHVQPCGQLRSLEHVAGFLERLTAEGAASYQVLCSDCHSAKTAKERANP